MVQSAVKILQQNEYMTLTDEMDNPARIMFSISRDDLYKIRVQRDDLDHFIRTILRIYNGVFSEFKAISEAEIASLSGYNIEKVKELLQKLWQLRIIRYIPSNRSPMLYMNEARLPRADIYISPETYLQRKKMMYERFENMLRYANNETECRGVLFEQYFGDKNPKACGVCDICLQRRRERKITPNNIREQILEILSNNEQIHIKEIAANIASDPQQIGEIIDQLKSEDKIITLSNGKVQKN